MVQLGEVAWPDLRGGRPLLVLPVGSLEQHGPHLPLDTDTRIAVAVAVGLADRLRPLLVAPALAFGASGEHAGFPGTLSLGTQALAHAVVEIVRSADDLAAGVVLVNGHGGNLVGLRQAVATLAAEGRRVLLWAPTAALARVAGVPDTAAGGVGDLHAGRSETSLLLHLAPELVRLDQACAGPTPPLSELIARGVAPLSPSGVLGDPAGASAREGARLLGAYIDHATDLLLAWAERRGIAAPRRSPPATST
ncbi:mycofactocin biosynthesis peptidyl-dipeptidase MftE [Frankia sp. Ag45/Mut15]|uniref:Mycofactocin biosynthesis peptidyl-dipeptidase MftE n=1 Tax=Frankia umida TaxID=573489 RepID=A0ABT0K4Y5_9ACTN|nr:mycofactocin biosynthesis peptidyl-dipeptidase MftE [Frankia umida]MCK9878781.1 mycofactocin biosynthesis peptidyl-dipeptidase MftE [Frankia umida]